MAGVMAAIAAARAEGPAALAACIRELGPRMDGHAVTAAVTRAGWLVERSARRARQGRSSGEGSESKSDGSAADGSQGSGGGSGGGGEGGTAGGGDGSESSDGDGDGGSGGGGGAPVDTAAERAALAELRAEAAELLRGRWRLLDGFGLCYCVGAMARLRLHRDARLAADMAAAAAAAGPRLPPRVLSQLLWGLVGLRVPAAPEVLDAVLWATGGRLWEANAYDCSQLAWGLARLGAAPPHGWWGAFFRRAGEVRRGPRRGRGSSGLFAARCRPGVPSLVPTRRCH
jgi:hypothetical protein